MVAVSTRSLLFHALSAPDTSCATSSGAAAPMQKLKVFKDLPDSSDHFVDKIFGYHICIEFVNDSEALTLSAGGTFGTSQWTIRNRLQGVTKIRPR